MVYVEAETIMALKDVKVGRGKETILVDPTKLVIIPGWNEKEYSPEKIAEMKHLLRTQGQRSPIRIIIYKKDKVFQTKFGEYTLPAGEAAVVHGHRRVLSSREISEEEGKIFQLEAKTEDDTLGESKLILSQVTDNLDASPTPLQRGYLYRRSMNLGETIESISEETGQTVAQIKKDIALATMPGEIQDLIKEERVSSTNVTRIVENASSDKGALELIKLIADREADVFISAEAAIQSLKDNGGNTSATLEKLQKAAEIVKEQGKSRVGRKHIDLVDRTPVSENESESNDEEEVSDSAKEEVIEAATAKLQKLRKPSYRAIGEELLINSAARVLPEGVLIDEEAWNEFKSHFADLG